MQGPKTILEVLKLKKEQITELCKQHKLNFAPTDQLAVLQHKLLVKLGLAPEDCAPASSPHSDWQAAFESFTQKISTHFEKLMELQVAQFSTLVGEIKAVSEERTARLTDKVAELEAKLQAQTQGGAQTSVSQAEVVRAAVEAVTDAGQREQKKLNLRLTRLPADVQSQSEAESMVSQLMQALDVNVEPSSVTFHRPSYSAVASSASAPEKASAVLVTLRCMQEKVAVLRARGRLRNSERFSNTGVNEDLTKLEQTAKSAAWPAFLAARREGKRTSWRAGTLLIEGVPHQPPVCPVAPPTPASVSAPAPGRHSFSALPSDAPA